MPFNPSSSAEQPLLYSKISTPRIPQEYVRRPHLTGQIERGVKGPLTLLSAPAGYGKTNLLVEWTTTTTCSTAWLSLNREDNDLVRFFRYLISALQVVKPGLGEEPLDFIQSTKGSGLEMGLTLLVNEIAALSEEINLVIDEFQLIEAADTYQGFRFLLEHLPQNLHLVIASRSEPDLDLALQRAKGRVVELGADELRFSSEEVALFFKQTMGLQLPAETVLALEERTDGWITGLQMAAISIRNQADPLNLLANLQGDVHYLVDFLAEEVLDRQPEDVRQFLLRSSVLDALCGPLCEAVIKPEAPPGYGTVMLDRLERANLFIIALDEKHEWFRYHHLFSDFLRHIQADINPGEIPLLQKRAALWFEQQENLEEAFRYALAAGDEHWAANLIERNIKGVIKTGEINTLTLWIGKLPDEIIHQYAGLSVAYVWGLIAAYRLDDARYWLDDLQQHLAETGKDGGPTGKNPPVPVDDPLLDARSWNIHGGLAICRSTLALLSGNVQQAKEYSREAVSYLQEENPFIHSLISLEDSLYYTYSGDTQRAIESLRKTARIARQANNLLVMIVATCQMAEMQMLQGHLNQAMVTLQKAQYMAVGPGGKVQPLAGIVDAGIGEIYLERNCLEKARDYLERGCRVTQPMWLLTSLNGMVSLARLLQARGDIDGSQALIDEASQMALSTESSQWDDTIVSAIAARLALQRDDLAAAFHAWKNSELPDITADLAQDVYPYHIYEYLLLTQARFFLVMAQDGGDTRLLRRALELLEILQPEAVRFNRFTSQIEILVLQSLVLYALGEVDQAVISLSNALAMGEGEGYRRTFLDEGRQIAGILVQCRQARQESGSYLPSAAYIESLLSSLCEAGIAAQSTRQAAAEQAEKTPPTVEDALPVTLSAREVEVLRLIAEGKSNQEISSQLYLALNTVKRHAYNIYAKLEVKKRTQAVQKARQLGLIP